MAYWIWFYAVTQSHVEGQTDQNLFSHRCIRSTLSRNETMEKISHAHESLGEVSGLRHAVPQNDEISFIVMLSLSKHSGPRVSVVTGFAYQVYRRFEE